VGVGGWVENVLDLALFDRPVRADRGLLSCDDRVPGARFSWPSGDVCPVSMVEGRES
jgi:hypothetical protein